MIGTPQPHRASRPGASSVAEFISPTRVARSWATLGEWTKIGSATIKRNRANAIMVYASGRVEVEAR